MSEGVCKYCGCTEDEACPGGCAWIDPDERTICSACTRRMTDLELIRATRQESLIFDKVHRHIELNMDLSSAMILVGLVQVALRHPLMGERRSSHIFGQSFVADVAAKLEKFPALGELLRRGGDPRHDVPFHSNQAGAQKR